MFVCFLCFFPFLTKVLQTPRGSLFLSNPLCQRCWQPIRAKGSRVKVGQCPGRGSSRSPAGSTEGLRKTGGKTVLFVSPGGPCTPSSQAPGRDEMIINFLSPHHHHPWREVCTAHPCPIPDPHVWPLSLQDTQPLPLLQGSLTKGTPCYAQNLHTLLHMWTCKVFLEAQSSAHRALPNTPFSTQGVKMGGGQRETHGPRQLRLPLPVSPWPGKGLGLGGGTRELCR